jgi:hypothetical protein
MKKSSLVVGMVLSSMFLCGNEYLGYEESHFSSEPIDTVQNIIDVRDDFNSVKRLSARTQNIANKNYSALKNVTSFDADKVRHTSLRCTYKNESTGNIITSIFKNKNNMWHLQKIQNTKKQLLNKVRQKVYDLYASQSCVDDFRLNFESTYPNSRLTLIGREAIVNDIVLNKKDKTYFGTFNLSYYSLSQYSQSGWHVSKINLKPIKKRVVVNKKVPSKYRGFYLKETIPYMPNIQLVSVPNEKGLKLVTKPKVKVITPKFTNQTTKLTKLVCNQEDKYIRMVFTFNTNEPIKSKIRENGNNYKYIKFDFNGKGVKPQKGNCDFLSVNNNIINLENFPHDIKSLKYGNTRDPKTSYIDFFYEKSFFRSMLP